MPLFKAVLNYIIRMRFFSLAVKWCLQAKSMLYVGLSFVTSLEGLWNADETDRSICVQDHEMLAHPVFLICFSTIALLHIHLCEIYKSHSLSL